MTQDATMTSSDFHGCCNSGGLPIAKQDGPQPAAIAGCKLEAEHRASEEEDRSTCPQRELLQSPGVELGPHTPTSDSVGRDLAFFPMDAGFLDDGGAAFTDEGRSEFDSICGGGILDSSARHQSTEECDGGSATNTDCYSDRPVLHRTSTTGIPLHSSAPAEKVCDLVVDMDAAAAAVSAALTGIIGGFSRSCLGTEGGMAQSSRLGGLGPPPPPPPRRSMSHNPSLSAAALVAGEPLGYPFLLHTSHQPPPPPRQYLRTLSQPLPKAASHLRYPTNSSTHTRIATVVSGVPAEELDAYHQDKPPRWRVSISGPTADLPGDNGFPRPELRWHTSLSGQAADLPLYPGQYPHPHYNAHLHHNGRPHLLTPGVQQCLPLQQLNPQRQPHSGPQQQQSRLTASRVLAMSQPGAMTGLHSQGGVLMAAQQYGIVHQAGLMHPAHQGMAQGPQPVAMPGGLHGMMGMGADGLTTSVSRPFASMNGMMGLQPSQQLQMQAGLGRSVHVMHGGMQQPLQVHAQQQQFHRQRHAASSQQLHLMAAAAAAGRQHQHELMAAMAAATWQQPQHQELPPQLQPGPGQQQHALGVGQLPGRPTSPLLFAQMPAMSECPVSLGAGPHQQVQAAIGVPMGPDAMPSGVLGPRALASARTAFTAARKDNPGALLGLTEGALSVAVAEAQRGRGPVSLQQLQQERALLCAIADVLLKSMPGDGARGVKSGANANPNSNSFEAGAPDDDVDLNLVLVSARRHVDEWTSLSEPLKCGLIVLAKAVSLLSEAAPGPGEADGMERYTAVCRLLLTLAAADEAFLAALRSALMRQQQQHPPPSAATFAAAGAGGAEQGPVGPVPPWMLPRQLVTSLRAVAGGSSGDLTPMVARAWAAGVFHGTAIVGNPSGGNEVAVHGGGADGDGRGGSAAPGSHDLVVEEPQARVTDGSSQITLLGRSLSAPAHRPVESRLLTSLFSSFHNRDDGGSGDGLGAGNSRRPTELNAAALAQLFGEDADLLGAAAAAAFGSLSGADGGRASDSGSSAIASFLESFTARSSMALSSMYDRTGSMDLTGLSLHPSPRTSPANPMVLRAELASTLSACGTAVESPAAGQVAPPGPLLGAPPLPVSGPGSLHAPSVAPSPPLPVLGPQGQPELSSRQLQHSDFRVVPGVTSAVVGQGQGLYGSCYVDVGASDPQQQHPHLQRQQNHQPQHDHHSLPPEAALSAIAGPGGNALGVLSSGDLDSLSWDPEALRAALRILQATAQLDG